MQENGSTLLMAALRSSSRPDITASAKGRHLIELASKRRTKVARIIWICVVFACVIGCLGQVFTFLEIFWR